MGTKSLGHALQVLKLFDSVRAEWSVSDLARATGLNKSHVSKIVREFAAEHYLAKDQVTRRYRVGPRALTLGSGYLSGSSFARRGTEVIRHLVGQTGFTATLNVVDGSSVLFLAAVRGSAAVDASLPIGSYIPLHATAAGKVSAAFFPSTLLRKVIESEEFRAITFASIRDPKVLLREIYEIRKTGYAKTLGESTPGVGAIAAPVIDSAHRQVGAISTLIPLNLFRRHAESEFVVPVREAAVLLSRQLGAESYTHKLLLNANAVA